MRCILYHLVIAGISDHQMLNQPQCYNEFGWWLNMNREEIMTSPKSGWIIKNSPSKVFFYQCILISIHIVTGILYDILYK